MPNPDTFGILERRAQVEEFWAARGVYADSLNVKRRADWEARKALLLECDLAISVPKMPPTKIGRARKPEVHAEVVPLRSASRR